jgi:hypothetical protein
VGTYRVAGSAQNCPNIPHSGTTLTGSAEAKIARLMVVARASVVRNRMIGDAQRNAQRKVRASSVSSKMLHVIFITFGNGAQHRNESISHSRARSVMSTC